jgi:hypothetical protein
VSEPYRELILSGLARHLKLLSFRYGLQNNNARLPTS